MSSAGAGYSGTPLAEKLGLKPGLRICALGAPGSYPTLLAPLPAGLIWQRQATADTDLLHQFFLRRTTLQEALGSMRTTLRPDCVFWVSWPKKSSGVSSDISEDIIRADALPLGWVDVKVCAVDATWSALKLVVRKALR